MRAQGGQRTDEVAHLETKEALLPTAVADREASTIGPAHVAGSMSGGFDLERYDPAGPQWGGGAGPDTHRIQPGATQEVPCPLATASQRLVAEARGRSCDGISGARLAYSPWDPIAQAASARL